MSKSIHERVRAAIAKREAAKKRAEQVAMNRSIGASLAAETRSQNRKAALLNGTATPRNLKEAAFALSNGDEDFN